MTKRHAIQQVFGGGALVLFLIVGLGAVWSRAAEVKAVPPAGQAAVGAGGPGVKADPAATPPASLAYSYQSAGKPDPFMPFIELDLALKKQREAELSKKAASKRTPISPLQQADIGHFILTGIIGDGKSRMAVVEDGTAKKIYPLFVGTTIGQNEGRVAAILPDRVIVEERFEDLTKKAKKAQVRRITIMLHKEE